MADRATVLYNNQMTVIEEQERADSGNYIRGLHSNTVGKLGCNNKEIVLTSISSFFNSSGFSVDATSGGTQITGASPTEIKILVLQNIDEDYDVELSLDGNASGDFRIFVPKLGGCVSFEGDGTNLVAGDIYARSTGGATARVKYFFGY
tara:strand:+ start:539 stop:985 length:447 start_codon:yes stop_codon:yes gene_type:complete